MIKKLKEFLNKPIIRVNDLFLVCFAIIIGFLISIFWNTLTILEKLK
jgi:hypothetical protein